MKRAVYPGSFDPVTLGHIDVIKRASLIADELIVGVLNNHEKTPLFSTEERVWLLRESVSNIPNVRVEAFSGLAVDFVHQCKASFLIRGLRAVTDFEFELQMAHANRSLDGTIDTVFLTTDVNYAYVSSTIAKEIASYGGDVSSLVTPMVMEQIYKKIEISRNS